ncbi:MAG: adenylosuccinate synthetase, partial [Bacteroidota bacterium]
TDNHEQTLHTIKEKYKTLFDKHKTLLSMYDYDYDIAEAEKEWFECIEMMKEFTFIDSEHYINKSLRDNKRILAEGAQGTMLDIDFGSYPYVTSSNTICAGTCTGLGIAPTSIGEVLGVFKAYCTRVGSGPFPTELFDQTGDKLRKDGNEFGSTTGRPRRCGWIDLVALRYAIMINGVTQLVMTKADVLDAFDSIKVATAYKTGNKLRKDFPYSIDGDIKPAYKELPGWNKSLVDLRKAEDFPPQFKTYINFLETELQVPVRFVSVGPDREQIIQLS